MTATLSASKGGATVSVNRTRNADMSGDQMISNVQAVGTSWEALTLGDVSTIGYTFVRNMDATNYVELALANDDSGVFAKLLAGDVALFPAKTATMYAKANTAGCNCVVAAVEL